MLAIVSLMAAMAFVGLSVDLGMITVTQTRMQSTADAAALGAVQEIVVGIREAGEQGITETAAGAGHRCGSGPRYGRRDR